MPHMEGIFINGEKAKFHPEDILDTDASQYTEEIGESVTAYLTEHLTNPSNPPIDTSLSIAGAAADAKETGDQISQLKSDLIDFTNNKLPININTSANTYIDKSTGEAKPSQSGLAATDYIGCSGLKYLDISSDTSFSYNAFYDSNKTFIGSFAVITEDHKIPVVAHAAYFRLSALPSILENIVVTKGEEIKEGIINSKINSILNKSEYLSITDNITENTYIDKSTGEAKPSQSDLAATDYIGCSGLKYLDFYTDVSSAYNAFYDSNKTFISSFTVLSGDGIIEKIPDNAAYFRMSNPHAEIQNIVVTKTDLNNIQELTMFDGLYYDLSGQSVDINSFGTSSSYRCCVENCSEGDTFFLNVTGLNEAKPYAFIKKNGEIITSGASGDCIEFVHAPKLSAYLVVNDKSTGGYAIKIGEKEHLVLRRIKVDGGVLSSQDNIRYGGGKNQYDQYWESCVINRHPIITGGKDTHIYFPIVDKQNNGTYAVFFRNEYGANVCNTRRLKYSKEYYLLIPDGVYYVDIMLQQTTTKDLLISTSEWVVTNGKRVDHMANDPQVSFFEINRSKGLFTSICYMLPPNYSHDGDKVPLVIWFDGNGNYSTMDNSFSSSKYPGLQYVRDEGFAVMQVFSWGNYYYDKSLSGNPIGWDQPYPVPICLDCIKKGIEYIIERYNIDSDDIHIMSKSMGGIISTYFVNRPIWNFKSIGMFSPAMDVLALNGRDPSSRMGIAEELGFVGENLSDFYDISIDRTKPEEGEPNFYYSPRCQHVWLANMGGLARVNPIWIDIIDNTLAEKYSASLADAQAWHTNPADTNVYTHSEYKKLGIVPVKIWAATQDEDVPYRAIVQTVNNWRNTGHQAEIRTADSGHSYFDVDSTPIEVTTILGITHNVTCGWIENVEWIRNNSSHPPIQATE